MHSIETIVEQCRQGDRQAFDALVTRFAPRIGGVAYSILLDSAETEDAVQEIFLKAYRNFHRFQGRASVETWLIRIAVNHCRDRLRRRKVRRWLSLEGLVAQGRVFASGDGEDPMMQAAVGERNSHLWQAVASLEWQLRVPFLLRYHEEMKTREIAEILNVAPTTVYDRLRVARTQLRERLDESALSLPSSREVGE